MQTQNSVVSRRSFAISHTGPYPCNSHRFIPNAVADDIGLLGLLECHSQILFRVKNLDVMCIRSRFCRIFLMHREVLCDSRINQQGRFIVFNMMTGIVLWPIS